MKLNKFLLLIASMAGLVFMSCENEMKQDPELDIVVTGDGVVYDGQTITVQKGTLENAHRWRLIRLKVLN